MTPEAVARLLLDRGHLTAHDIVHGEVAIVDSSARNSAFRVRRTTGPGLVYKKSTAPAATGFEPRFYALVRTEPAFASLARWVPRVFDARDDEILLELVGDGATARARAHGTTRDATAAGLADRAPALGQALAACHSVPLSDVAPRHALPRMEPWAFRAVLPEVDDLAWLGPVQRETLRTLHRDAAVAPALWERRRQWAFDGLTHGDVRWLNLLLPADQGVVLIDWEHAGVGDPAWDLASAWYAWLAHGIETLPLTDDTTPADASSAFAQALPPLLAQIGACTAAYRQALAEGAPQGFDDGGGRGRGDGAGAVADADARAAAIVQRAAALLPFRLCQGAMEWARDRTTTTPFIVLVSQLAVNLVKRPARDTLSVLGLPA